MAKIDESHKSAQEDELIVLQSIFCNGELKINKAAAAWNAWAPIDVCIKIVPTAHSNTFVSLTVHITCSDKYPAQPPQITFDHVEGVPAADVDELLKEMNDLCSERASEKMPAISEICELARDYLYQFNKKGPGDMNQTMLENNKKKETEKQMLNDLNRQREKAEIELENNSRLERLNAKKEEKERENRMKLVSLSEGNEDRGECFKVKALDDSTLTIYKSKNEAAPSRKLPHPDISEWIAHINEGELKRRALVTEWRFEFTLGRGKKQSPSGLMDLRKFESDLDEFVANTLRRLRSLDSIDQALYSYLFIHLIKRFTSPTNFKCSVLVGHNIDPQHRPLQMAIGEARTKWRIMLPIFASSAVCALKWIHDQHLYHGSIDHSSIWIHRNPDYTFKISDFFLVPSLLKLANDFAQITTPDDRKSLSPPVEAKESLKSAQQRDIAAVGVIMMDIHGESASDDLCTQFEELCLQGSVNADNLLDHEYLNRGFFDNLQMSKSNASDDPVGTYEFQKSSRLMSEWAMRTHLGGGGFGDVILAKNKVDGNDYAIKRIRLNRQSEQINRKITREAKIFSKLNHTNIVRYYNAWIEDVNVGGAGSTETDNSTRDALSDDSIIYRNAQDLKTTETTSEWTTSFRRVDDSRAGSGSSRSVSQIGFFANQPRAQVVFSPQLDASSGSEFDVLFVKSHDGGGDELTDEPTELDDMDASSLTLTQQNKVLYIQMEFCPRSTLRNLISSGDLYLQPKKVWRIFREILNGLQYIHHQGLVHRDIKPMNILLGVNDQVKIGDFGLATRGEVKKRKDDADSTLSPTSIETTRDVGTVFYMAPECDAGNMEKSDEPRTKIDVYSAGVVLFELFYSPLTGMERVDVLKSLRASLAFPDDYGSDLSREQTTTVQKLAKWMLQQKPENRPTVDQILASDQVPLVELEDNDFQKMFSQVIRNKKGSLRDWTMRNLFETATTSATNYLFDQALCEELAKTKNFAKHSYIEKIEDELSSCLKIHAFMPLTTQSLLPYSKTRTGSDTSPVKVMDESGFVFTLPPCLRKNFIRYCNHAQISRSKRYSFGKTFHRTDGGLHPIERLVCAVDVVGQSSTAELMAAEVLSIVTALTAELSCLSSLNWVLRVGHTMLVKSAMNHHGLTDEDLQKRVLAMLNDKLSKSSLTRVEKQNYLMHMCALSSEQASALLESLESSPKLSNVRASMRSVCKNKNNEVRDVAKGALQELDEIFKIFDVLCAERQAKEGTVVIDPSFCYEPDTFADGFVFQLEMTLPKVSGKHTSVPVMAGGRYDKTLAAERHSSNPPVTAPVSAIGFNLNVDILANIAAWVEKKNESVVAPCSVMVCSSESESDLSKEKYGLALQLRKKKIATDVLSEPVRFVEDLVEHCRNDGIANLLVVRDYCTVLLFTPIDAEKRNAGVQMSFEEALAKLSSGSGSQELASHHLAAVSTSQPVSCHSPLRQSSGATFSNVDLVFAIKMSHSAKKKLENQVRATTADFLLSFSAKRRITICVSELPTDAVRQLVGRIDRNFSVEELSAVFDHAGKMKQSGKMKQDFKLVFHELQPIFEDPGRCSEPIIIYSTDGFWKAIL